MKYPLKIGIIGLGGFAGAHHEAVRLLEAEGTARLICTCDPNLQSFGHETAEWDFEERGIRVYDDYLRMLDDCRHNLDEVVIPTPVPLHAAMHRACVERGLAVYLEKPPTLDYRELEDMLAVEERAEKSTMVGFSFIVETPRQTLKRRLLEGEFGDLHRVSFFGLSPRPAAYFNRVSWAGRLIMDGRLVLDSCMGNAMAHYVHNLLFWAGKSELFSWADIESVEAELYRAHAIEGMDTVFVRAALEGGCTLQAALSHACAGRHRYYERLDCEKACVTYVTYGDYRIEWRDGRIEEGPADTRNLLCENHRACYRYLLDEDERPLTRLKDTLPFVRLCSLTYVAAGRITAVKEPYVERITSPDGEMVAIQGLEQACAGFLEEAVWPSSRNLPWARPGGKAGRERLCCLEKEVMAMRGLL